MMWLLARWLAGCCCCVPPWPSPSARPVPPEHQALVGDWVCTDGAAWSFRADGGYAHRERNWVYADGIVVGYGEAHFELAPESFLDEVVADTQIAVEATDRGLCTRIGTSLCAKVDPRQLPPELAGLWVGAGLVLEVRGDGHARYQDPHGQWVDGALTLADGGALTLRVCTDDLVLAARWIDGAVELHGVPLVHSAPDFDVVRLSEERVRREGGSSGGGGGSRRSHDHDFDHD